MEDGLVFSSNDRTILFVNNNHRRGRYAGDHKKCCCELSNCGVLRPPKREPSRTHAQSPPVTQPSSAGEARRVEVQRQRLQQQEAKQVVDPEP